MKILLLNKRVSLILGLCIIHAAAIVGCGGSKQALKNSKPSDVALEDSVLDPTAKVTESSVPFAMLGGGPKHLHRSLLRGPHTMPVIKAQFETGARVFASPVTGPEGTIYLGSLDGALNALRPDGTLRWSFVFEGPIFSTAAISLGGFIYVGCDDNTLAAFSTDGTNRWTYSMKHDVDSAPVIGDDGMIYVGGDGLHAVTPAGQRRFKVWLGGHVSASPSVRSDGAIVVGSHDHRLYAVAPDGNVLWTYASKGPILSSAAVLSDDHVIFGSDDGAVYRVNNEGFLVWSFETGGPVQAGIAVSIEEYAVYVSSKDGTIYALDAATGKPIWQLETAGGLQAAPMLDNDGWLYVGSRDRFFYGISARKGTVEWRVDLGSEIDSTAAIIANNTVVVGTDSGTIYYLTEG